MIQNQQPKGAKSFVGNTRSIQKEGKSKAFWDVIVWCWSPRDTQYTHKIHMYFTPFSAIGIKRYLLLTDVVLWICITVTTQHLGICERERSQNCRMA